MKAMIFTAGLGTRLQPWTKDKPKALIEINGIPMLQLQIERIKSFGFTDIIINVHHFADQIIKFIKKKKNFGINISISDETNLLLDTGGGLKNVSWFFNNSLPFLLYNVDILTDLDLKYLYDVHSKSDALSTVAVGERTSNRYLLFNKDLYLGGWKNVETKEKKIVREKETDLKPYAFSGIHIINPDIFKFIKLQGVFSIIELYLSLAKDHKIKAFVDNESFWMDLGKKDNIIEAEKLFINN